MRSALSAFGSDGDADEIGEEDKPIDPVQTKPHDGTLEETSRLQGFGRTAAAPDEASPVNLRTGFVRPAENPIYNNRAPAAVL